MSDATIAVTGATGQQGRSTADALLALGANVIGLVRDTSAPAARDLEAAGIRLRHVDLTDFAAVRDAVTGVDAVFAMATMTGPDGVDGEVRVGTTIADAVADAAVPYAVYSSVGGAERRTGIPHFESKRRIEERFETTITKTTFLRPVFFMDNFATFVKPAVEDGTIVVRCPLPAHRAVQLVSVVDVGKVAAALLTAPDTAPDSIEIGADELTGVQIAAAFAERYGRSARYEALPLDVLDDPDQRAMFAWFDQPSAYAADFAATRALDPEVVDFRGWLERFGPELGE